MMTDEQVLALVARLRKVQAELSTTFSEYEATHQRLRAIGEKRSQLLLEKDRFLKALDENDATMFSE